MADTRPNPLWSVLILVLVVIIVAGVFTGLSRYQPVKAIEISLPARQESQGYVEIGGAVANPGIYPFYGSDSLDSLLRVAGGTVTDIGTITLKLTVPLSGTENQPQKVNINRAAAWLLEALPGIGATRAQAIIIYREQNGPFSHTSELMKVEGIGQSTYENLKDLITVTD